MARERTDSPLPACVRLIHPLASPKSPSAVYLLWTAGGCELGFSSKFNRPSLQPVWHSHLERVDRPPPPQEIFLHIFRRNIHKARVLAPACDTPNCSSIARDLLGQHANTLNSPSVQRSPSTFVPSASEQILYLLGYCPVDPLPLHSSFIRGGSPLSGSERRTTQRFTMRLPLTVRWTTGAAVGETSTESRDVSSRGVYFYLGKDVKEGSPVEILLTLPNEITLAGPVRVRCLGRVQRTESRDETSVGVVAAIERYEFLRGDEEK
jgi:PilZ domain-containing protein